MSGGIGLLRELLERGGLAVCFEAVAQAAPPHRVEYLAGSVAGPAGTTLARGGVLLGYVRRKGLEAAFDRARVRAVLAAARALPGEPKLGLSVHAATLASDFEFLSFLADAAQEHWIDPARLVVELCEDVAASQRRALSESLAGLRAIGARLCLDDVGGGPSNYKMMLDCRPDYCKVGGYFVQGAARDADRQAVLRSIVRLAERFGARVIAHGAASAADCGAARAAGVALLQGVVREELAIVA